MLAARTISAAVKIVHFIRGISSNLKTDELVSHSSCNVPAVHRPVGVSRFAAAVWVTHSPIRQFHSVFIRVTLHNIAKTAHLRDLYRLFGF